jgi:hypothetical protein
MRRVAGTLLLLIGLLPVALLAALAIWLYTTHMYTVGLSTTLTGKGALAGLAVTDLVCLGLGTWLWHRVPKRAA